MDPIEIEIEEKKPASDLISMIPHSKIIPTVILARSEDCCTFCLSYFDEGEIAVYFKFTDAPQAPRYHHVNCTPDPCRNTVATPLDFENYENLSVDNQKLFSRLWEGEVLDEDEDSDSEDECGFIPCIKTPLKRNRLARPRRKVARKRHTHIADGGMYNIAPSTANFAYMIKHYNPNYGLFSTQWKKLYKEFRQLSKSQQKVYYDEVYRNKLIYEQKEKYMRLIKESEALKEQEAYDLPYCDTSKLVEEDKNFVDKIVSKLSKDNFKDLSTLSYDSDISNFLQLLKFTQEKTQTEE